MAFAPVFRGCGAGDGRRRDSGSLAEGALAEPGAPCGRETLARISVSVSCSAHPPGGPDPIEQGDHPERIVDGALAGLVVVLVLVIAVGVVALLLCSPTITVTAATGMLGPLLVFFTRRRRAMTKRRALARDLAKKAPDAPTRLDASSDGTPAGRPGGPGSSPSCDLAQDVEEVAQQPDDLVGHRGLEPGDDDLHEEGHRRRMSEAHAGEHDHAEGQRQVEDVARFAS
jgi:hypothetical protein